MGGRKDGQGVVVFVPLQVVDARGLVAWKLKHGFPLATGLERHLPIHNSNDLVFSADGNQT